MFGFKESVCSKTINFKRLICTNATKVRKNGQSCLNKIIPTINNPKTPLQVHFSYFTILYYSTNVLLPNRYIFILYFVLFVCLMIIFTKGKSHFLLSFFASIGMSRPVEGKDIKSTIKRNKMWCVESMKFALQSVKISTVVRKKMESANYLDNANMSSVTLNPNSRKTYVSFLLRS